MLLRVVGSIVERSSLVGLVVGTSLLVVGEVVISKSVGVVKFVSVYNY